VELLHALAHTIFFLTIRRSNSPFNRDWGNAQISYRRVDRLSGGCMALFVFCRQCGVIAERNPSKAAVDPGNHGGG